MAENDQGRVLLSVTGFNPRLWFDLLSKNRQVTLEPDGPDDPSITYAVVWKQRPNLLSSLPNLRAIFSIGAGVDHIFTDPGLPDVPIVRVVDENLTQYMTEYVLWRVLDHQRQGMLFRAQQKRKIWREPAQRPAGDIAVGIMGLGQLGRAAARTLAGGRVPGQRLEPQRKDDDRCCDVLRRQRIGAVSQLHRHSGRAAAADATDDRHHQL